MDYVKVINSLIEAGEHLQATKEGEYVNSSAFKAWKTRVLGFIAKLEDEVSSNAFKDTFHHVMFEMYPVRQVTEALALLKNTKMQIQNGEITTKDFASQTIISTRKQYDVFLSHAHKDKLAYVDSLYMALRKLGVNIFYDIEELTWGDNWKQVILDGVAKSEFAIVVISKEFFGREWTERELNEFLQRQNENGQKLILPLLFELSFEELKNHYPELEFIQSIKNSEKSVDDITILLAKELIKRYK